MLLPLKAVILRKPRRDGNFVIYFQYCSSGTKRVLLNTKIAVPQECWNKKRQSVAGALPETLGSAKSINNELQRMRTVIERLIAHSNETSNLDICQFLKTTFDPTLKLETLLVKDVGTLVKKEADFFEELDAYEKDKKRKVVSTNGH